MLNDIMLLNGGIDIRPLRLINSCSLTRSPLFCIPPLGQKPLALFRKIQEFLEVWERVFFIVETAGVAGKLVVVFDAHAVAVDELGVGVFLRELVQVSVRDKGGEEVASFFGHCGEISGGFWLCLICRGAVLFVSFPVRGLTFSGAVGLGLAFGAAFEGLLELSFRFMAFGTCFVDTGIFGFAFGLTLCGCCRFSPDRGGHVKD